MRRTGPSRQALAQPDSRLTAAFRPAPGRRTEAGFTLVELLVVMVVAGILSAAIVGMFVSATRTFAAQEIRLRSQDDARLATNQLTRYLRMASSSASNQTSRSDSIETAAPQEIVFYSDLDGDGYTEKVRYYLSAGTLKMQTASPNLSSKPPTYPPYQTDGEVIRGVRNADTPAFHYYRYDQTTKTLVEMTSTSTPDQREQIVAIDIHLVVNEAPELAASDVTLDARAQIRQRYDGGL